MPDCDLESLIYMLIARSFVGEPLENAYIDAKEYSIKRWFPEWS
jgi:hypothetical protein